MTLDNVRSQTKQRANTKEIMYLEHNKNLLPLSRNDFIEFRISLGGSGTHF